MPDDLNYRLNEKQRAMLDKPLAERALMELIGDRDVNTHYVSNGYERTRVFHERVRLPVRTDWTYIPPVSERLLRAKLLLEEVLETFEAMGLELEIDGLRLSKGFETIEIVHVEGSTYDPIEVADGLADIKVIANGTALCFGIPMDDVDFEVWASNMTKVGADGKPIVNRCLVEAYSGHDCEIDGGARCKLLDPAQPIGKILKPESYTPANIARLYAEYEGE